MFKKILGDSPVTSIVGILAAFFVVLQEQLTTGEVSLFYAVVAALIAVVGRFMPDGPLKALFGLSTETKPIVEEPVVEEPVVVENTVVETPITKTKITKKIK
jgi:hypothetical protein